MRKIIFLGSGVYISCWSLLSNLLSSGDCHHVGGRAFLVTLVVGTVFLVGSGGRPVVVWTLVARAIPVVEKLGRRWYDWRWGPPCRSVVCCRLSGVFGQHGCCRPGWAGVS